MPRIIEQWMYPINKTDLDVLRFAHFLALAAITVRFLPRDWPGLRSPWLRPLILCGQHSLEIFCLGVFLAFAGHFVLAEVSGGAALHFLVSVSGIVIMSAHGVGDFVVQALRRQRCVENKKHRRQRRSGGRGRMRSGFQDCAGRDAACRLPDRGLARAEDPAQPCDVPAYLLTSDSPLPKVAEAVKNGQPLNILVVGSRSSTIAYVRSERLPRQVAGGAEREAAAGSRSTCP